MGNLFLFCFAVAMWVRTLIVWSLSVIWIVGKEKAMSAKCRHIFTLLHKFKENLSIYGQMTSFLFWQIVGNTGLVSFNHVWKWGFGCYWCRTVDIEFNLKFLYGKSWFNLCLFFLVYRMNNFLNELVVMAGFGWSILR